VNCDYETIQKAVVANFKVLTTYSLEEARKTSESLG
jgi:hypothetical protein